MYLYSFHTQWKSGWLVILFNPTIPQSVPRSNNLTSSPDKRGFPTRNAASPLSSYLSCLLSHHITSPQTQKQHWQTQHHNTTLNTTSQHNTQHNTYLLSFPILPVCFYITPYSTTHNNNTDNHNHNHNNNTQKLHWQLKNNTGNQQPQHHKKLHPNQITSCIKSFSSNCIFLMSLSDV